MRLLDYPSIAITNEKREDRPRFFQPSFEFEYSTYACTRATVNIYERLNETKIGGIKVYRAACKANVYSLKKVASDTLAHRYDGTS